MNKIEILRKQLRKIIVEVNTEYNSNLIQDQQDEIKNNQSILKRGTRIGRVWIHTSSRGYDISISGQSLEPKLRPAMVKIFGHESIGFKQSKKQAFWSTEDLEQINQVIIEYAKAINTIF
ncbi:hypothetical protein [Photobacterium damselae]|uniref:hypothetical protein n=1 Tax=Photobacterium damselae TaxID=38293 RepID=UPI001F39373B|nr:hypothetical protein [Photobacterium damselae]UKA12896.1 hypothetical protein IHC91_21490 [Photobacterium damselae subsp. damselae]